MNYNCGILLPMNEEILNKLAEQNAKLDVILRSSEQMRKYFLWTMIISISVIVLPLIGLVFALPSFFDSLTLPSGF